MLTWLYFAVPEREKGKTVEVGRAYFETEKKHFTILDAPGHKSFVPNMIGGAAQADLAVLVISARKGEFETGFDRGGQTREHAMLAKTAGVKHLVVLINKMDDPTVSIPGIAIHFPKILPGTVYLYEDVLKIGHSSSTG